MKLPNFLLATSFALCAVLGSAASQRKTKASLDAAVSETVKQFNLLDPRHAELENKAAGVLIFPQSPKADRACERIRQGALQIAARPWPLQRRLRIRGFDRRHATHSEIIVFMTAEALQRFRRAGWSSAPIRALP